MFWCWRPSPPQNTQTLYSTCFRPENSLFETNGDMNTLQEVSVSHKADVERNRVYIFSLRILYPFFLPMILNVLDIAYLLTAVHVLTVPSQWFNHIVIITLYRPGFKKLNISIHNKPFCCMCICWWSKVVLKQLSIFEIWQNIIQQ